MNHEQPFQPYQPPPRNLGEPYCVDIPGNSDKKKNKDSGLFIKRVQNEARLVRELEEREKAMTAENPKIRDNLETTDICIEFQKLKHDDLVKERRRKYLQDKYEDLRRLKIQIFLAHAAKYQASTAEELERKRKQVFIDKKLETQKTRELVLEEMKLAEVDHCAERDRKLEMICDLKEQMEYKRHLRHLEKLEKAEEHKKLLELTKTVEKEQFEEKQKALKLKTMTKQIIEDFLRERKEFKIKSHQEMLLENERERKAQEEIELRNRQLAENKQKAWEAKMACSEKIGEKLDKLKKEKLFQENQFFDLLVEERDAKEEMLEKKALLDQAALKRKGYHDLMEYQMSRQAELLEKKRETEEAIKNRILLQKQMAEEEEQLREKDRQKKEALRTDILEMMREKEQKKIFEREAHLKYMALLNQMQLDVEEEVRKERMNLLKAEPLEILKYLPCKSLSREEREELGLLTTN